MLTKVLQKSAASMVSKFVVFVTLTGVVTAGHAIAYNSGRKKGHKEGMQDASKHYGEAFQEAADELKEL